jgi:Zn-dependent protease
MFNRVTFYPEEVRDLLLSSLVLSLILFLKELDVVLEYHWYALVILMISFLSFALHEVMHKVVAQKYGYVSFYSINPTEMLLSVLISLLTPFVVISFGATNIIPYGFVVDLKRSIRDIALAGPLTNIFLSILTLLLLTLPLPFSLKLALATFYKINLYIALFNLLPIPPLDGSKILNSDPVTYFLVFGLALLLYLL